MAAPLPTTRPQPPAKSHGSQALLGALAVALFAVLAWKAYSPHFGARPTDRVSVAGKPVDLNTADRNELLQVPGIGPSTADAILAHRRQNGRFESLDELDHVHGIGPKTVDKLRPWFTVGPGINAILSEPVEKLERKPAMPATPSAASSTKLTAGQGTINVNTAAAEELQKLPAVGVKMAERIIAERQKSPFKNLEDLKRAGGIGVKTLEKLKPLVRFAD